MRTISLLAMASACLVSFGVVPAEAQVELDRIVARVGSHVVTQSDVGQARRLKLVDDVVAEPLGGAHRDPLAMAEALKSALVQTLSSQQATPIDTLLAQRRRRIAAYGVFKEL